MTHAISKTKRHRFFVPLIILATPPLVQAADPGGVSTNLQLWLKADAGASASSWTDSSVNSADASQATGGNQPTLITDAINFNPALDFDGSDDFMEITNQGGFPSGSADRTLIGVGMTRDANAQQFIFAYGQAPVANNMYSVGCTNAKKFGDVYLTLLEGAIGTCPTNQGEIITFRNSGNTRYLDSNGVQINTSNGLTIATNKAQPARIGMVSPTDTGKYWNGYISEIILYSQNLSATEQKQVYTYLGIKYGVTLDSSIDYIASDGTTVIYPSTGSHSGYINDIAGIGTDNGSGLSQPKSRSVNSDRVITITGSGIADGNFLIWGNDDGALTFSSTETPNGNRFPREWRIAETGETGSTTISFDLTNVVGADLTSATKYSLLIDIDGNFSDASITTGTTINGSTVEFSGVNLGNGQYFSLAYANNANILSRCMPVAPD
jgi:hypothetical protein